MTKIVTKHREITRMTKVASSHDGSPCYRVHFSDGSSALTETNGQIGYAATNFAPAYESSPTKVRVGFTTGGRIRTIEVAE